MTQALTKLITVQEFLENKPENGRYELHNGAVVQMSQPIGEHEEVSCDASNLYIRRGQDARTTIILRSWLK